MAQLHTSQKSALGYPNAPLMYGVSTHSLRFIAYGGLYGKCIHVILGTPCLLPFMSVEEMCLDFYGQPWNVPPAS